MMLYFTPISILVCLFSFPHPGISIMMTRVERQWILAAFGISSRRLEVTLRLRSAASASRVEQRRKRKENSSSLMVYAALKSFGSHERGSGAETGRRDAFCFTLAGTFLYVPAYRTACRIVTPATCLSLCCFLFLSRSPPTFRALCFSTLLISLLLFSLGYW